MTKLLSRDAILAGGGNLRTEDVAAFGGIVRVRELTAAERDTLESSVSGKKQDLSNLRARVVSMAAIDEAGERVFKVSDALRLGELSANEMDRVFWVVLRLSGMRAGDVEQMTENFT